MNEQLFSFRLHEMEQSMEVVGSSKEEYKCDICSQTFNRAIRLANHQLKKLCGGISCTNCKKVFKQKRELDRHKLNSENIPCNDHCERKFCTRYDYEKHKRQHKPVEPPSDDAVKEEIFPSVFDGVQKYEETKRLNYRMIKDFVDIHDKYKIINKELKEGYTYGDLLNQLTEIKAERNDTFLINVAFGFTLYNQKDDEYK